MSYRMLHGFCIGCFAMGLFLVAGGFYLGVSGAGAAGFPFSQVGLVWCGMGILSQWAAQILKAQSTKIQQLELELRELRTASQTPAMT